jgi:hypothetical protein
MNKDETVMLINNPTALLSFAKEEHARMKRVFTKQHPISREWKRLKKYAAYYSRAVTDRDFYIEDRDVALSDGIPLPYGYQSDLQDLDLRVQTAKSDVVDCFANVHNVEGEHFGKLGLFLRMRIAYSRNSSIKRYIGAYLLTPWQAARERVSGILID